MYLNTKDVTSTRIHVKTYRIFLFHLLNSTKIYWHDLKEHLSPAEFQEIEMILQDEIKDSTTAAKKTL